MPSTIAKWSELLASLRARAQVLPEGQEREVLEVQIEQLETAVEMARSLSNERHPADRRTK